MNKVYTDAISNSHIQEIKTMLKSFFNLVTYYFNFITNAENILKPLYLILCNDFKWHYTKM